MPQKSRITICDDQMSLALFDLNSGSQRGRVGSRCIHNNFRSYFGSIGKRDASFANLRHCAASHLCAASHRALDQKPRRARRIQHCVFQNEQSTCHAVAQIRLNLLQLCRVDHFGRHTTRGIVFVFAIYLRHLFFVGCDPDRSALLVFNIVGQLRTQRLPKPLRIAGQSELRFGVIHDNDVPHARGRRSASNHLAVDNHHLQAAAGKFVGAGRAYDARANNHNIEGFTRVRHSGFRREFPCRTDRVHQTPNPPPRSQTPTP